MKIPLIIILSLVTVLCLGLSVTNPTVAEYRSAILKMAAEQEADRAAAAERHQFEQQLAALKAHLTSVQYEGRLLDAVRLRHQYPLLAASFIEADDGRVTSDTLEERLGRLHGQMLHRVAATRDAMGYASVVTLSSHTSRTSYGLWSLFVTCTPEAALAYIGLAGHFIEQAPRCPAA